jgi:hypothetical protein
MKKLTKQDKIRMAKSYKQMCLTQLCCKETSKVGRTRRGRKKGDLVHGTYRIHREFPYSKRGQHNVIDGVTVAVSE